MKKIKIIIAFIIIFIMFFVNTPTVEADTDRESPNYDEFIDNDKYEGRYWLNPKLIEGITKGSTMQNYSASFMNYVNISNIDDNIAAASYSDEDIKQFQEAVDAYIKVIEQNKWQKKFGSFYEALNTWKTKIKNGIEKRNNGEIQDEVVSKPVAYDWIMKKLGPNPDESTIENLSEEERKTLEEYLKVMGPVDENMESNYQNYMTQVYVAVEGAENKEQKEREDHPIYYEPNATDEGRTVSDDLDGIIGDANGFLNKDNAQSGDSEEDAKNKEFVKSLIPGVDALQSFSSSMYNILLVIGIVVAVVMGAILGVKFMMASVEGKAQIKEWLLKYAVGCAIVFGAFGAWKIIVTILEQIA